MSRSWKNELTRLMHPRPSAFDLGVPVLASRSLCTMLSRSTTSAFTTSASSSLSRARTTPAMSSSAWLSAVSDVHRRSRIDGLVHRPDQSDHTW